MATQRDARGRFTKMGLGAEFTFDDSKATPGMKRAHGALSALHVQFSNLGIGAGRVSGAFLNGAAAVAPLRSAIAGGAAIAVDFEKQMSAVNSILMADDETMGRLEKKAKELGAATKFTAKEAAEGMEMLAMAGFKEKQIMDAIGGTLALAAAGSLKLSAASEITGNVLAGMGLEAGKAAHVADVLAKGASDSNTSVEALGVAFKYSAGQARSMGISVEETTYLLGAMADAGMKGSSGGTGLQNMLSKLAKPTEVGAELFKKMNLQMTETGKDGVKRMRPVQSVIEQIGKEIRKVEDPLKRAALQEQVFGKIGQKAFSAMLGRIDAQKRMSDSEVDSRSVASFGQGRVTGAAERMAAARLKGVAGSIELMKSATEGLVLELFNKTLTAPIEKGILALTNGISGVVQTMQALAEGTDIAVLEDKFGPVIVGIAMGLRGAVEAVGDAITWLRGVLDSLWGDAQSGSSQTIAAWVKWGVIITGAVVAVLTLGAGLIALIGAVWAVVTVATTLGAVLAAAFWPVTIIVAGVVGLYYALRRENESLGETVSRVFGIVVDWLANAYENYLKPFFDGVIHGATVIWPALRDSIVGVVRAVMDIVADLWGLFDDFISDSSADWFQMGVVIMEVFGDAIGWVLGEIKFALETISHFVAQIRQAFRDIADGSILSGLARLGMALFDLVLEPVREILKAAVNLADAVYVPVPDAVRTFAFGGLSLERAKERLNEDDDDVIAAPRFAGFGYAPDAVGSAASDLAAAKNQNSANAVGDAVGKAMAEHEKNKKGCETTVNSSLNLDGKKVAQNQAKIKDEMSDRTGFKNPPYQRRLMLETGSAPGRG